MCSVWPRFQHDLSCEAQLDKQHIAMGSRVLFTSTVARPVRQDQNTSIEEGILEVEVDLFILISRTYCCNVNFQFCNIVFHYKSMVCETLAILIKHFFVLFFLDC